MDRRAFIGSLAGGLLAVPLAAEAQPAAKHTIGVLNLGSADSMRPSWDAFREGLRERGYVEGDSVAIEFRSAGGQTAAPYTPARWPWRRVASTR